MKSIALPLILASSILSIPVYGGTSFDFEGTNFPVNSLFGQPVNADVIGNGKATLEKVERNGQTEKVARVAKEGVVLKTGNDVSLFGEFPALTISMTLKTDEAVPTPIYFQRIDGSIGRTGYLSFHSQHHQGDPGKRKGNFRLAFTDDSGEGKSVTSSEAWEYLAGEWHSVAMVFNQGKVRFYLNGEQVGEPVDAPVTTLPAVQSTRAGIRSGRGFAGEIDDLVILPDRALDDQQIKTLHQEGTKSEAVRAFLNQ